MDAENHGQIMEVFRFFGPYLSIIVIILFLVGMWIWFVKRKAKKAETLEGAASETEGNMNGRDAFNLLMDLRHQSQSLIRDHERFEKGLDKLEEHLSKDHDLLIELRARFDASK